MAVSTRPDYGKKYICFKCGCKFYDLNKKDALCPKCKIDQKDAPLDAIRQSKVHSHPKPQKGKGISREHLPDFEHETEEQTEVKDTESDDDNIPMLDSLLDGDEEGETLD